MSAYLTTYYLLLTRCASPQGALVVATTTSYHLPPLTRYVSTSRRPSACRWISARCASKSGLVPVLTLTHYPNTLTLYPLWLCSLWQVSARLTKAPCALVQPQWGVSPQMQRFMRAQAPLTMTVLSLALHARATLT